MSDGDDVEAESYHYSALSDAFARDAIYRALARPASSHARPQEIPSWDNTLVASHAENRAVKRCRSSELDKTQERIVRELLNARRLQPGRNWAQSWAREIYPERCEDKDGGQCFLHPARRWALRLQGAGFGPSGAQGPDTVSTCTRLAKRCGNALDAGVFSRALRP